MSESESRYPASQPPGAEHPRFPHLFSPLKIGPLIAKNRIVNTGHATAFVKNQTYTDQLIAYHQERARGGAAIIVSQATSVVADYGGFLNVDDRIIPWYEKVVEAVHPYGAKYFAELSHGGRQGDYAGTESEVFYAPSPVPNQPHGKGWRILYEMDSEKIHEVIDAFAAAAERCRRGGLDGIELHFAHGNIVQQFMSPLTNRRTDEWGGSLESRLRFALEVLYAVRNVTGRDMVVGCRLNAAELDEDGLSQWDMMEIAGLLDESNVLDYISLTMGHYSDLLNVSRNIPDMSFKPAVWASYGANFHNILRIPLFLVGRINHPALAEELLANKTCDMVAMARPLIADPYLPVKAFSGQLEDVRPCVGAMEGCLGHFHADRPITCIYNPVVSREQEWGGELPITNSLQKVVVVGGGLAGLECARVAAQRGHQVVLFERENQLGGQVLIAAKAPQREEIGQTIEWLQGQCEKAGVDIRLETEATIDQILELLPDVVVIATGALPNSLEDRVSNGANLVDAWTALKGKAEVDKRVLVMDETGKRPGFSVAEYLAVRGHKVELVTPQVYPGQNIERTGWRMTYQRLLELGVKFHTVSEISRVDSQKVVLRNVYTNAEETMEGVFTVVTALSPHANDELYRELKSKIKHLYRIGDALTPRGIEEAVFEGHKVAREI